MRANIGALDRLLRIGFGVGLLSLFFLLHSNARWVGLLGIVLLATALMRLCPLYSIFGLRSCPLSPKK